MEPKAHQCFAESVRSRHAELPRIPKAESLPTCPLKDAGNPAASSDEWLDRRDEAVDGWLEQAFFRPGACAVAAPQAPTAPSELQIQWMTTVHLRSRD